jgi:hypothetical protein
MTSKQRTPYLRLTLAKANPAFLSEWDNELNGEKQPSNYTVGSDRTVWWRCKKNPAHSWDASISNRYYGGTGCPYCAGRKVDASNCLATTHPSLAAEWHPFKNSELPTDVFSGSHKKIHWRCAQGHEWPARVYSRASGRGCPYCAGYYLSPESSIAVLRPDLLLDWHPEKNASLKPTDLSLGSDRTVWWLCKFGHEWHTTVQNRHRHGSGCPKCSKQSSKPEVRCFCELRTIFPDIGHRAKVAARIEVDLLIPSVNIVVQYDGKRYHGSKVEKDRSNSSALEALGFQVIRIRDRSLPDIGSTLQIDEKSGLGLQDIQRLLTLLRALAPSHTHEAAIDNYLARDRFVAEEAYIDLCAALPGPLPGKSLQDLYPQIAAKWHVEKNGRLSPADVTAKSNINVFWRCDRHDAYFASVTGRVRGSGCPHCVRYIVLPEDSLEQLYPDLAGEYHPTKNGTKHPSQIAPGTQKKYWWRCSKNPTHEWEAAVSSRVSGCNCPICCNLKIIFENSLANLAPDIASQWHYERNFPLKPDEVGKGSQKAVWWQCAVDPSHVWSASIASRTRLGVGCSYCNGKKTDPKRSLAVILPDLAREWHPDLNDRDAASVLPGSGRTVWWQCLNDPQHIWQARVDARSNGQKKCPSCYPSRRPLHRCQSPDALTGTIQRH